MDFETESCLDLGLFKKTLRNYRKVDDNIVPKLNGLTTRSSNLEVSCTKLHKELDEAFRERERLIGRCVKLIDNVIEEKKQQLVQDPKNKIIQQSLRVAETQAQQVHSEYTVESIVRERTLNVFHQRCRSIRLDPSFGDVRKDI